MGGGGDTGDVGVRHFAIGWQVHEGSLHPSLYRCRKNSLPEHSNTPLGERYFLSFTVASKSAGAPHRWVPMLQVGDRPVSPQSEQGPGDAATGGLRPQLRRTQAAAPGTTGRPKDGVSQPAFGE